MRHLVIFGPPGTGKTRALVGHVAQFLEQNAGKVLFCSHTRAAAQTAIERFGAESSRLDISTLHSYCFKERGYGRTQTVDDAKLSYWANEFGLDMDEDGEGRQYVEIMAYAQNTMVSPQRSYEQSSRPGSASHFSAFVKSYLAWKAQFGYVDFGDMLANYAEKQKKASGHSLLVVDEAQDLTPLHWAVIHKFMELHPGTRVIVAGDDDQCIYGYSGADAHGPRKFAERYGAEVQVLDQSYRVPSVVHKIANSIAKRMATRVDKTYRPRAEPGQWNHLPEFGPLDEKPGETLILYSDRFVRREEVEPVLMDTYTPFIALNGFPAPLQSKAGKALVAVAQGTLDEQGYRTVLAALSDKGKSIWNMVGRDEVVRRLRERDLALLNFHYSIGDYLNGVDLKQPVNVRISTIHGAKGMEADDVHLITRQSASAISYSFRDPDASHRVFYVGTTRARQRLYTYWGAQNNYDIPSPYDSEVRNETSANIRWS
jgi:DNA helicase-2/ATP-dependent DNA helicase PcrA